MKSLIETGKEAGRDNGTIKLGQETGKHGTWEYVWVQELIFLEGGMT